MKIGRSEVEGRLARFRAAAAASGIRLTHQRLEICREVASSLEHPDAETVFSAIRARLPTVSLDTVYRTLWMLNDLGVITTLGPRRDSVRFDANLRRHHHYVCVRCGATSDFESGALDALRIPAAARRFGSVVSMRVEVLGRCNGCARETKPGKLKPPRSKERSKRWPRRRS